jgi:Ca2+-transporting ATPase
MAGLGIVVTVALAGAMVARDASAEEAFLVGISVAVAAVPEGLAATVTIALALGARAMAARGAIVRRLAAVETLGSATVIASDKTGTLTENRLRLRATEAAAGHDESELVAAAALASTARILDVEGEERLVGDPVDAALVLAAHERGLTRAALTAHRRLVRELPFDAERRRMTLVYDEGGCHRAYVKGALEVLLARAAVEAPEGHRLTERAERWAADGLRVLAVAERVLDDPLADDEVVERHLELVGLVALHDPLRPTAPAAVRTALAAGLKVEMLTGDHPATARAVGRMLGLPEHAVHARITPAEKLLLVERLQAEGEVVAVTGDGVNDAPALKRADVGVSMGASGTEAAREASDLVLTDDDFATIVAAIREGRAITDNIRKFVAFLLSANLGEVALFAVAIPAGLGAPLTVVQVLLINVLTDGLPAVALARDPAAPGTMRRPPETSSRLFPRAAWAALAAIGALVGASALAAFLIGRDDGDATAATMAFVTIALAELALVFSVRSPVGAAWRAPRNPALLGSVVLSSAVVGLAVYTPALQEPLGTVALAGDALAVAALLALVPAVCVETGKALLRRGGRSLDPGRIM